MVRGHCEVLAKYVREELERKLREQAQEINRWLKMDIYGPNYLWRMLHSPTIEENRPFTYNKEIKLGRETWTQPWSEEELLNGIACLTVGDPKAIIRKMKRMSLPNLTGITFCFRFWRVSLSPPFNSYFFFFYIIHYYTYVFLLYQVERKQTRTNRKLFVQNHQLSKRSRNMSQLSVFGRAKIVDRKIGHLFFCFRG